MCQRAVSLLLLPCVLLMQAASMGHAHGSLQPAGHASRPHFHLPFAASPHDHSHSPSGYEHGEQGHEHGEQGHEHGEQGHEHGEQGHEHGEHDCQGAMSGVTEVAPGTTSQRTETTSQRAEVPPRDHDSDAIFLESVSFLSGPRSSAEASVASVLEWAAAILALPNRPSVQPPRIRAVGSSGPPLRNPYACPLYIWQGVLLI